MADKASNVVLNFKMNGQVQYAQTLKQINMVMQTASKEYTSHITAMGKDASMTDKLVAEKKKLETQMAASAQKVAMLTAEFEQMQNDSSATADDLQKLYNQLLTAETAHAKLENAMKRVNEGLSEEAIASREAKDELKNLTDDAKRLQAEQQRLVSSFELQNQALDENASDSERAALALKQYEQQTAIARKAIQNLEQQLEASKRAFGENSVEVMQLETKLNQARSGLAKLNDEFNKVESGSEKATFSIENFAGKATAVAALATAVAAVGTAAFDVAKQFDQASAKIQMSLGLTAEEAKGLEDASRNIWKEGFGESLDEVTDALVRVKQNMHELANDSNLEQITRDSMVLAQTFDSDVNEVVRAGYNIMKNFGVSSSEAFDMMAWGAQNGLNFSQELFDNLAEYSGLFANMGYSVEEYFGILQRGSEAGVYNLDYLNDVMKEFQIRIKDGSDATSTAFADMTAETQAVWDAFYYGEATVKDVADSVIKDLMSMDDQTYASMLGVTLFGTKWEDLESSAMYAMLGTQSAIEDTTGKMQQMIDVQEQTFGQRWSELLRTASTSLEPIGMILLDLAEKWLPKVVSGVESVATWFANLSPAVQGTIMALGGITAVIGPLAIAIGPLVSGIASLIPLFASGGVAAGALGTAFTVLTGPIGMTVAAIAGIGIAVAGVSKDLSESSIQVEDWRGKVSESTKEALGGFMDLSENATLALNKMAWSGQVVTEEMANNLIGIYDKMGQQVLTEMQSDHAAQLQSMTDHFATSSALTEAEEAEILAKMQESNTAKELEQQEAQARFVEIINTAKEEKRKVTEAEQQELNAIHQTMVDNAIQYLTENQREQKVILETLKNEATEITAQQAAEVVQNSKKQKDEVVLEAKNQYNETVAEIIKQRDETGTISAEQAERLIEEAKFQRDETVKNATDMHNQVVSEAQKQATEHVDEVDWETGEVKTKWELLKENIGKVVTDIGSAISEGWQTAWTNTTEFVGDIVETVTDKFNDIQTNVSDAIEEARKAVETGIENIVKFFTDMELEIPDIKLPKLPKIKIEGSFSLNPPKVPSIKWFANGGIMTRPTAFGINGNNILAGGEAGPEAILPLNEKTYSAMGKAIANAMGTSQNKPITIVVQSVLDGKVIAESTSRIQNSTTNIKAMSKGVSLT